MRLSKPRERDLIAQIRAEPLTCQRVDPADYRRADGFLLVYRDNTQEFLHRRFYRLLVDPGLKRNNLIRICETWGCVNPHHYRSTNRPAPTARSSCPDGHPYTTDNLTASGHCRICTERRARRMKGLDAPSRKALRTHCPANHEYTAENTYIYPTRYGMYRKCRACTALRNAARRSASVRQNHQEGNNE